MTFQFQSGAIQRKVPIYLSNGYLGFNSKVVRFKAAAASIFLPGIMFQFQSGAIQSGICKVIGFTIQVSIPKWCDSK